jgi:hypothetical protein
MSDYLKVTKINVLKKAIPDLLEYFRKWFGNEIDPNLGIGKNWKTFFKDAKLKDDTYKVSKTMHVNSRAGNYLVNLQIMIEIVEPVEFV